MRHLRNEFNQENFTLTLENYFYLAKYKLIENIFSSCLMILFSLGIIVPIAILTAGETEDDIKILIFEYFGLASLFISISSLFWNSLLHFHLKKMTKSFLNKTKLYEHKQDIYYLTFHWIAKIYFSKEAIQDSLKKIKKDWELETKEIWSNKYRKNSEENPISDVLGTLFPLLSLLFDFLLGILLLFPMLKTQFDYWIGGIWRIKKTNLVQRNFMIITDKFETFLIDDQR